MQPLKLNSFFSFNFTIFFGLVLKADWIFLLNMIFFAEMLYDTKITKKKKKDRKCQNLKKKNQQKF